VGSPIPATVLALLALAVPAASAQESAPADTLAAPVPAAVVPDSLAVPAGSAPDSVTAAPDSLGAEAGPPVPTPGAIREPEVDLWDTGVSPTAAVVMTPLFPGWGQLYAENSWRAALGFGVQMYFWTNMLSRDRQAVRARDFARNFPTDDPNYDRYNAIAEESWAQMRDFAWWSGGALLIIALDAYVGAHLFDFESDPVPVPDRWDDTFGPVGAAAHGWDDGPTVVVFQWQKTF